MKIVAKTLFGLEPILSEELKALGAKNIVPLNRAIQFEGGQELLYRCNLASRLALRFLVPLSHFKAHNDRHLYQLTQKIDWSEYLDNDMTFSIDSTVYGTRFRHSQYAALKVKDAIVDQFKDKTGKRPSVDTANPDVRINLHISETEVNIALDSSGESLEKRGYRTESNEAPISETLAAALLLISGWDVKSPLIDAMTGSGTIAIEAALLAGNIPPGLFRKFGFQRWKNYNQTSFDTIEQEERNKIVPIAATIYARDIDAAALTMAKRNAQRAGVVDAIIFDLQDFTSSSPTDESATIIMNPPYGERLEEDDEMPGFYHEIGFRLKHHFPGHTVWIISGNLKALKRIGLKPNHKHKLFNGAIECRFNGYSLFKGKAADQN
ncbi:MAG: THUMP domain-containing protein [Salibacteraceae bacterium]